LRQPPRQWQCDAHHDGCGGGREAGERQEPPGWFSDPFQYATPHVRTRLDGQHVPHGAVDCLVGV
jgi:hypothetical protein